MTWSSIKVYFVDTRCDVDLAPTAYRNGTQHSIIFFPKFLLVPPPKLTKIQVAQLLLQGFQYGLDVYQIGQLTWCVVQNVQSLTCLDQKVMLPENFETSKYAHYSQELRRILDHCTRPRADLRIDSLPLLRLVRDARRQLISEKRFPSVELLL